MVGNVVCSTVELKAVVVEVVVVGVVASKGVVSSPCVVVVGSVVVVVGVVTSLIENGSIILGSNLSVSGFKIFSIISGGGNKNIKRLRNVVLITSGCSVVDVV